jgi:repressor of nif and glnA expression
MIKVGNSIYGTIELEMGEVLSILKKTKKPQLTKKEIESLYNRKMGTKNYTLFWALKILRERKLISREGTGKPYTPYIFSVKKVA